MQAMACAGAKVLNAQAVEFARRAAIVIHARKTGDTSGRETLVSATAPGAKRVTAVVGANAVSRVRGPVCNLGELLSALGDHGASTCFATSSEATDVLVDRTGVPGKDPATIKRVCDHFGQRATSVGLVSLIGGALNAQAALQTDAAAVLAGAGITCLSWFATHHSVAVLTEPQSCDSAVRVLHQAFIEA